MPIWRVLYNKIEAEKSNKVTKSVEVNTNTKIKEVRREKAGKAEMLAVDFALNTTYKPKVGSINIEGTVYYTARDLDKVTKTKGKRIMLEPEAMKEVHTAILREPVIIAINNAKNLGLPLPISFPKVKVERAKKKKKKTKKKGKKKK